MKHAFVITAHAVVGLSACAIIEVSAVDTGRTAAKSVVGPIVAQTVPGPAGVILTDCIIDNASGQELVLLAAQGATPENVTLVSNILARPETVACATAGLT